MQHSSPIKEFDEIHKTHLTEEEERLVQYISEINELPYMAPFSVDLDNNALQILTEKEAREAQMAIFYRMQKKIKIACRNPRSEIFLKTLKMLLEKKYQPELFVCSTRTLNLFWDSYKDIVLTSATKLGEISILNEELDAITNTPQTVQSVKKLLFSLHTLQRSAKISKNIEYIVSGAVALNASDIHIEAAPEGGVVRFRLDGVLVVMHELKADEYRQIVIRMKLVAGMKINIIDEAQDGAFTIDMVDRKLRIRASSIPEGQHESFVLRILDPKNVIVDIEKLGIHPVILSVLKKEIEKPHGMIITTGPTGSGKTTTLYSLLNFIKNPELKIITLEDPIEYVLPGLVQTQVEEGYTFAGGLRAILRQDPDVILVGEIRDGEVAQTAVDAALTGHLVLSTLHTNDAIGALPRLMQMKIDPKVFSRSINVIMAQRLLRKLCPVCKVPYTPSPEQKTILEKIIAELPVGYKADNPMLTSMFAPGEKSNTCPNCYEGYKGRTGIYELFLVTKEVEEVMLQNGGARDIQKAIVSQQLPTLMQDGLVKVCRGETSLQELESTVGNITSL